MANLTRLERSLHGALLHYGIQLQNYPYEKYPGISWEPPKSPGSKPLGPRGHAPETPRGPSGTPRDLPGPQKHPYLYKFIDPRNLNLGKVYRNLDISKLDFFEQIHLFKNAKIIIGPHGAAFTNIIFSNPGLKIIELIPRTHSSIKCEKFSNLLNFNYTRVNLDLIEDLDKNVIGDIEIPILNLEEILKKIL